MPSSKESSRPAIGVMVARLGRVWGREFMSGITDAALEQGVTLLTFVGDTIANAAARGSSIYDFISADKLDGLIIYADLAYGSDPTRLKHFVRRFAPLPLIAASLEINGIPSLLPDNYGGMCQAVSHLIKEHGYRRIAFICGPEGQGEAEQRFRAYADTLAQHSIPVDAQLILPGDYTQASGHAAVKTLLDERGVKVDAIVAASDRMAFGALEALQEHGLQTPGDVALTSFDDIMEARLMAVPLTTVSQSFYTLGQQSIKTMLSKLHGAPVPDQIKTPTEFVVRWSCGCLPASIQRAAAPATKTKQARLESTRQLTNVQSEPTVSAAAVIVKDEMYRQAAIDALVEAAGQPAGQQPERNGYTSAVPIRLFLEGAWDAFISDMSGEAPGSFLRAFDVAIQEMQRSGRDVPAWHEVLSVLRRQALLSQPASFVIQRAEDLLQQARLLIGEVAQRAQAYQRLSVEQEEELLQSLGNSMATILKMEDLAPAVVQHFPALGIRRLYLAVYEPATSRQARLVLSYDHGKVDYYKVGPVFITNNLLPVNILPDLENQSLMILPVSMSGHPLGYMVIELGPREWEIYARLRNLFSSTMFRVNLVEQQERDRRQIERLFEETQETADELALAKDAAEDLARQVQEALRETNVLFAAASAILEASQPEQICQNLASHFNRLVEADRVVIFLVDHKKKQITLSVADGNIVDDLQTTYEELNRGISGMVFRTGRPVLSLHAEDGIEPVETAARRKQAGTGALVVVPLMTKSQVIGTVTTLNRIDQRKFTQHDVDLLMAMATQSATAIENALLYQDLAAFNQQLEQMVRERTEDLRKAYDQLERMDKAKSDFIDIASHELRTPITVLSGYSQLLMVDPTINADANLNQLAAGIKSGSERMYEIVNSMLDLAMIDNRALQLNPEPVSLERLIKEETSRFRTPLRERQLSLIIEDISQLPPIEVDPDALRKSFFHLISNAIKYTPDGGSITISGRALPAGSGDCPPDFTAGGVEIIFQDTGIGIDPAMQELIFAKFFQTGEVSLHSTSKTQFKGGGPGLGLAIARGILLAHQGRLWVESSGFNEVECPGSKFVMHLPVIQKK